MKYPKIYFKGQLLDDYLASLRFRHGMLDRDFIDLEALRGMSSFKQELILQEQIDSYMKVTVFDKYRDFKENNKDVFLVRFWLSGRKDVIFETFYYEKDTEAKEAIKQFIDDRLEFRKERIYFDWVIKQSCLKSPIYRIPWNLLRYYSMIRPGTNWFDSTDERSLTHHNIKQFKDFWNNNDYNLDYFIIDPDNLSFKKCRFLTIKHSKDWEGLKNQAENLMNSDKGNLVFKKINKEGDVLIFQKSFSAHRSFILNKKKYSGRGIIIGTNDSDLILDPYHDIITPDHYKLFDDRYEDDWQELRKNIVTFQ